MEHELQHEVNMNKSGPPTIYPEGPLTEHITIRVTPKQKEFILKNTGTADLRNILLDNARIYNDKQLPLDYKNAGTADTWGGR
jgi:hypothetical protein